MIDYQVHGDIAVITIDNPPVNALGPGILEGIEEAVARAVDERLVNAVVLVGAGGTFVAGADINIFTAVRTREEALARSDWFHRGLRRIEDAAKPVVAAIHGNALGGGLDPCRGRRVLGAEGDGTPPERCKGDEQQHQAHRPTSDTERA